MNVLLGRIGSALAAYLSRPVHVHSSAPAVPSDRLLACLQPGDDLRNVFDLARYLLPTPPVPLRWRRKLIHLGSGDPTRAICSTLIAQAFQSIRYPILPIVEQRSADRPDCPACVEEILRVRHHSLFVPRDFDVSPYFAIVKPALETGFDYTSLHWQQQTTGAEGTPDRDQPFP